MKAFGVRLAAGAVTILVGAIMAAQAQKEQQNQTELAWTEDSIPPAKFPEPIGRPTTDELTVEVLKPGNPFEDQSASAVQLVQHTEPVEGGGAGAMDLPEGGPAEEAAAGPGTLMPMRIPDFTGAQPMEDESASETAPSMVGMGLPQVPEGSETPAAAALPTPQSAIDFLSSPSIQPGNSPEERAVVHGQTPTNGLRGASGNGLRSEPFAGEAAEPFAADSSEPFGNEGEPFAQEAPGAGTISASSDQPSPESAAAAGPASLLQMIPNTPPVQETVAAPREPQSTLRINRASATPIGDAAESTADVAGQTLNLAGMAAATAATAAGAATAAANAAEFGGQGAYNQPVSGVGTESNVGPAGGFGVPANYGATPRQTFEAPAMQPSRDPQLPAPQGRVALPGNSLPGNTLPPSAQGAVFQGAGYKQRADAPLPSGPTLPSPGDRSLDGPQSPSVVIEKRAPQEVKVGKTSSFVITVKNVGGSTAMDVRVQDRVPTGMRLDDAMPRPDPRFQPELVWSLGDLEPQQERTITLQLTPLQEGELGSVARVTFEAAASVRTISTRPELKIVQRAPEKVLIGQQLEIELEVSNPGTGEATGVLMQEDVPAGLEHPQGRQLDNLIGTLAPGEVRRQVLRMRAAQAGRIQNVIRVKGDDGLESTHTVEIEVISPQLQVALAGPSRRYLERQAKYELQIANTGSAEARNVEISVQLDRGFTFVSTDYEGQYDSARHAVFWSLPSLPAGGQGSVPLVLLPVQEGNRVLRTEVTADLGVTATSEAQVAVDSLAELTFSINDTADPVEVGGETTYEIRVKNSGSRDDTNVRVHVQFPPGMQLSGNGDFQTDNQGLVAFTPRPTLKANDEVTYRVKARGTAAGRHLVKAIVTSDQSDVPVTKEESIMVYSDQ